MATRAQGHRTIALNELPFRGISINATTNDGSPQVYASDSGILFINEYAGATTFTLPVVADCKGKWFIFYSNVAQTIAITGGTAAKLSGGTTSAATNYDTVTSAGAIGEWCMVYGDGDYYYLLAGTGTWTATT